MRRTHHIVSHQHQLPISASSPLTARPQWPHVQLCCNADYHLFLDENQNVFPAKPDAGYTSTAAALDADPNAMATDIFAALRGTAAGEQWHGVHFQPRDVEFACQPCTARGGGDVHLTGFRGQRFNVVGIDQRWYAFYADKNVHVNVRLAFFPENTDWAGSVVDAVSVVSFVDVVKDDDQCVTGA